MFVLKKILHILPDDKFIDFTIKVFDSIGLVDNEYVIIKPNGIGLRRVKNIDRVIVKKPNEVLSKEFLKKLNKYEYVFIHHLTSYAVELVLKAKNYNRFGWFVWGIDIYDANPALQKMSLLRKTRLLKSRLYPIRIIRYLIKKVLYYFGSYQFQYKKQEQALKKISFVAPVIEDDYLLIKKYYKNSEHLSFFRFAYGDTSSFINDSIKLNGNNILFGNSASFTNNHIELIDILGKIDLKDKKLITILSYGDDKYRNFLLKYGKKKLLSNFIPIADYLPINDYLKLISTCEYVIMNHKRQAAVGNIVAMLYLGSKVFLRDDNPTKSFLDREGIRSFSINDLKKKNAFTPLTQKDKDNNRVIIKRLYSPKTVNNYALDLVKMVLNVH